MQVAGDDLYVASDIGSNSLTVNLLVYSLAGMGVRRPPSSSATQPYRIPTWGTR